MPLAGAIGEDACDMAGSAGRSWTRGHFREPCTRPWVDVRVVAGCHVFGKLIGKKIEWNGAGAHVSSGGIEVYPGVLQGRPDRCRLSGGPMKTAAGGGGVR